MKFKEKSLQQKFGIIGSVVFSLLYIIALFVLRDSDFILFVVPDPFSFVLYLIMIYPYFIGMAIGGGVGAFILSQLFTTLFFALIGYLSGHLVGFIASKVTPKK